MVLVETVPLRRTTPARVRAERLEARLRRFPAVAQKRVRALAAQHARLADLIEAFPALLAALALPRPFVDRDALIARVVAGDPLAATATEARAALWLRRFPPEALAHVPVLPNTFAFRRQIGNFTPKHWPDAPRWLEIVAEAASVADDDIALWFAREAPVKIRRASYGRRPVMHEPIKLVALHAWFSRQPGTVGHALIATPWTPAMQWVTAAAAAYTWRDAVNMHLSIGTRTHYDPWLAPGRVEGFDFEPILNRDALEYEALAMQNCVRSYATDLADNRYALWSIQREDAHVATLALAAHHNAPFPSISQLAGPCNEPAPLEVWRAALKWMRQMECVEFGDRLRLKGAPAIDVGTWRALWKPYWRAKNRLPTWLPLRANENALWAL